MLSPDDDFDDVFDEVGDLEDDVDEDTNDDTDEGGNDRQLNDDPDVDDAVRDDAATVPVPEESEFVWVREPDHSREGPRGPKRGGKRHVIPLHSHGRKHHK